mmetsp:Transcript_99430/g.281426  ORF Transcript_99430/g.281426 Transcript_99430/m.281426 type:complete len:311 (+) Transcript_99430:284-1216(+)
MVSTFWPCWMASFWPCVGTCLFATFSSSASRSFSSVSRRSRAAVRFLARDRKSATTCSRDAGTFECACTCSLSSAFGAADMVLAMASRLASSAPCCRASSREPPSACSALSRSCFCTWASFSMVSSLANIAFFCSNFSFSTAMRAAALVSLSSAAFSFARASLAAFSHVPWRLCSDVMAWPTSFIFSAFEVFTDSISFAACSASCVTFLAAPAISGLIRGLDVSLARACSTALMAATAAVASLDPLDAIFAWTAVLFLREAALPAMRLATSTSARLAFGNMPMLRGCVGAGARRTGRTVAMATGSAAPNA